MSNAIASYLRTHRKRSGLTQREMAELLGLKSGQIVSRYERLERIPSLETVFACQIIFGTLPHELYPGVYQEVEKVILRRVQALHKRLEDGADGRMAARKREVLAQSIERTRSRRSRL